MKASPERGIYVHNTDMGTEFPRFVDLTSGLVVRDFNGYYRRSVLGPAWAFLQALAYMVIFTFLRGGT